MKIGYRPKIMNLVITMNLHQGFIPMAMIIRAIIILRGRWTHIEVLVVVMLGRFHVHDTKREEEIGKMVEGSEMLEHFQGVGVQCSCKAI